MTHEREPVTLVCARCGATKRLVAYQVGGVRVVEPTCLDVDGCQERVERLAKAG